MPKILKATRFGNPILRQAAKLLNPEQITSPEIQDLIKNIRYTLQEKEYGVGLAAPQVGVSVALSVIGIKPTPTRPELELFDTVIINPEIIETYGRQNPMWEGCMSCGTGSDLLFAQVPRYKKIKLRYYDDTATLHEDILEGFVAHVAQHETDHLNGILFVDNVKDTSTYMMADEYRKRISKP
jgi:peptide deformylase